MKNWSRKGKVAIIAIVIVSLVVSGTVVFQVFAKEPSEIVRVCTAKQGNLEENIKLSGVVASEEVYYYYSEVSAPIETLDIKAGRMIKAGESVLTYRTDLIENQIKEKDLEANVSNYDSKIVVTGINDTINDSAVAATKYEESKKYVSHYSSCLEDARAKLGVANALLQEKAASQERLAKLVENLAAAPDDETIQKAVANEQKVLASVDSKLAAYDVAGLENSVAVCSGNLEEYKALQKEYEAKKEVDPTLNLQKQKQSAINVVNAYSKEELLKELATAKAGVVVSQSGIVSQVNVVKGQSVNKTEPLFTLESSEKVKVSVTLSKYELEKLSLDQKATITINGKEYEGHISNIDKIARKNESGTLVIYADIHIDNPDDNICLGIEANAVVQTSGVENAILVPVEAVNYDSKGTFCYLVKEGILVRQEVKTGISSEEWIEVKSGITLKDQIVNALSDKAKVGDNVSIKEQK